MSKYELFIWMIVIILRFVVMENYFLKNVYYKNSFNVNVFYRMIRFGSFKQYMYYIYVNRQGLFINCVLWFN